MNRWRAFYRISRRWLASAVYELRRTRRVIVPPESRQCCPDPIFICGVHRSGTTLLRLILDSHSGIACPPESFFIAPLQAMIQDEKAMEGLAAMGFDRDHVFRHLRDTISYFFELYAASHAKRRWADKTPSYIDCLDFIDHLFGPACRYILIFRHGLDVACSISRMQIREVNPHIAACGGDTLAGAARYWALQCGKLIRFRDDHPDRCFQIKYEDLTRDPEPDLRRMFAFLREPWDARVLRFHEIPHDHWIGLQDGKAADSRGFEPRTGAWARQPQEALHRMIREAGPMLRRLDYHVPGTAGDQG